MLNVYRTRVRAAQTDLNAALYHGDFFDIFDDARIETFRHVGCTYATMLEEGWALVIRHAECEYFLPARMDDELTVAVTVSRVTRVTMTICYECRRRDDLIAVGHCTFAFLDGAGKPTRIPASVRGAVDALTASTED